MPTIRRRPKSRRAQMDSRILEYLTTGRGTFVRFFVRREALVAAWREVGGELWEDWLAGRLPRPPFGHRFDVEEGIVRPSRPPSPVAQEIAR